MIKVKQANTFNIQREAVFCLPCSVNIIKIGFEIRIKIRKHIAFVIVYLGSLRSSSKLICIELQYSLSDNA